MAPIEKWITRFLPQPASAGVPSEKGNPMAGLDLCRAWVRRRWPSWLRSTPTRGRQSHNVELAVLDPGQSLVLGFSVEKVVLLATNQDIDLEDDESQTLFGAPPLELLGNRSFSLHP